METKGQAERLIVARCKVIRDVETPEIVLDDLVKGNIVQLYEGDGISADIRLIQSNRFSTNEFILTGESVPAEKDHTFIADKILLLAEQKNCAFMGTTVARGDATGLVYATGMQTEIGKINAASKKIKLEHTLVQVEANDICSLFKSLVPYFPIAFSRLAFPIDGRRTLFVGV